VTPDLPRRLGLADGISIVVGVMIGAGIFLVPSLVARSLSSPFAILGAWMFAGLLSFFGGLAFAELGAMIPATGGQYVFLREAYGPMIAFLCGWTYFLVSQSAAIGWLGVSFALYLEYFVRLNAFTSRAIGVGIIGVLAWINYRGVVLGAFVQKLFALAKVGGLALLVGTAVLVEPVRHIAPAAAAPFHGSDFGVALISCLLCYDGWATVSFVAGEIKDPQKNILRALAIGILITMTIYTLANYAYLRVLGVAGVAATDRVGATFGVHTMGPVGGTMVTLLILVSITGGLNGWMLTQPRVYFAQARDGLFFRRFGEVHPDYQTPGFSVMMQFVWAGVLAATGSFELLITYAMIAIWVFYGLTVAGVIVLRRTQPDRPRPYRMWGYPVTPALFTAVAVWFVVNTAVKEPVPSAIALGIIAAGLPVYYIWRPRSIAKAAVAPSGER
jgi:basic amino acid/polyamine antiporter, APA family